MAKRKGLSQKTRFEVFKRDKFTCQYCGAKAPDVVLQVDHIQAVANGGANDQLNLITSCKACNGGKGARALSDDSAVERQRAQLAELEERRQQIEMMVQWRAGIAQQDDTLLKALEEEVHRRTGWFYSDGGRAKARQGIKQYGFQTMCESLEISVVQYGKFSGDGKLTDQSADYVLKMVPRIAANRHKYGADPDAAAFAYIQGILRSRLGNRYLSVIPEIRNFRNEGLSPDFMKSAAKQSDTIGDFDSLCWFEIWRLREQIEKGEVGQ